MDFIERVDPELRAALEAFPDRGLDFSVGIEKARELSARNRGLIAAQMPDVPGVSARDAAAPGYSDGDAEVPLKIYEPDDRTPGTGAIYWIHGGGMVMGTYDDNPFVYKTWAQRLRTVVVSVEYRLAPEHPYPAPLEDCYAGLRWLWRNADELGVDQQRIVVAGGSAGGGLAAGMCLLARDLAEITPRAQVLFFPMIDDRDDTASHAEAIYPKAWHREANNFGWQSYLGDRYGRDDVPLYAAPARASVDDLRGLPPATIDVGELDAFRDEDIAYAQKLLQAGVPTDLLVTPGAFHASETYVPSADSSRRINRFRNEAFARFLA